MTQTINQAGIDFIRDCEGCRLESYQDSRGIWTIGVGSTKNVTPNLKITQTQADDRLDSDLKDAMKAVNELVKVDLTQNQFNALTSFTFNLGRNNLDISTLLKFVNLGEFEKASLEFKHWNKARIDGVLTTIEGLTRRREAEAILFNTKD